MPRWLHATNLLLLLGLLVLGASFYAPYGTARRVSRVEGRAQELTRLFLEAAMARAAPTFDAAGQAAVLARVRTRCRELGYPDSTLPEAGPAAPAGAWFFAGKHYVYMVTTPPQDEEALRGMHSGNPSGSENGASAASGAASGSADGPAAALEAYGWPLSNLGPGRTVFYCPASGAAAYSRNMNAAYAGFRERPARGSGRQRSTVQQSNRGQLWYRGRDEERWILFGAGRGS